MPRAPTCYGASAASTRRGPPTTRRWAWRATRWNAPTRRGAGRQRLGPFWGFLAGWGFVVGKLASCAAMALTVGAYTAPRLARPVAVAAVLAVTAVNYRGVSRTAMATRAIVAVVLAVLVLAV